jgi:hypothetical protein
MKTKFNLFTILLICIFSSQNVFAQEESRYDLSLSIDFNGSKTKLKISNISYSINNYVVETDPAPTAPTKPEPIYISVTTSDNVNKEFFKIFESNKNKVNGYLEIKDNFGKIPTRKIEFKNSSMQVSENMSNYANGNTTSITIYGSVVIIEGVSIFSK